MNFLMKLVNLSRASSGDHRQEGGLCAAWRPVGCGERSAGELNLDRIVADGGRSIWGQLLTGPRLDRRRSGYTELHDEGTLKPDPEQNVKQFPWPQRAIGQIKACMGGASICNLGVQNVSRNRPQLCLARHSEQRRSPFSSLHAQTTMRWRRTLPRRPPAPFLSG
nr:uncharacterized protein LOC127291872 [Lolium perenne]